MKNMKYEDFKNLAETRCSHRKFTDEAVSVETIEKLVDCARVAPSGHNLQPWLFIAVTNRDILARMAAVAEAARKVAVSVLPTEKAKKLDDYGFFIHHFKDAPLVFVVLVSRSEYLTREISRDYGVPRPIGDMIDIDLLGAGAAIQNLLLAAHSLGLGACWMTEPVTFAQKEIEALVHAGEGYTAVSVVAVGWSTKERKGPAKKSTGEILRIIG